MRYPLYILLMQCIIAISCNNNNEKPNVPTPEPPATPAPVPENKDQDEDGTTVKVDENGVSYENKRGDQKDEIKISEDSSRIEIKKK
jgi:hypothetical protein